MITYNSLPKEWTYKERLAAIAVMCKEHINRNFVGITLENLS